MKKIFFIILALVLMAESAYSRPQYSILQSFGTKCQSCHIAPNIGMQRNTAGWMSLSDVSLIKPEDLGLNSAYDAIRSSNSILDEKVMFGLDLRYQTARWSKPTTLDVTYPHFEDPSRDTTIKYINPYGTERDYMLMIFTPYVTITPTDWMTIEGSYNFAYQIEDKKRYPGQTPYTASIILQPWENLPSLRVGMIQPMVGTDWDDHTMMTRQAVTPTVLPPSIPCDYYEWGAQLDYEAIDWLGLTLGVYDSKNIADMSSDFVDKNNLSGLAKVTLHPPDFGTGITAFCGATHFFNSQLKTDNGIYFRNKHFTASSVFLHFGIPGTFAVMSEWMRTEMSDKRITNNYSFEFNYQVMDPIIAYARLESGTSEMISTRGNLELKGNKYSVGAKVFVLPYIALIPEYKIYDRDHVKSFSSQFACQLHIFY